jgi:hypothetical protein
MNKTVYIRDEDGPLWDRARELAAEKLSPVILAALVKFVADKEAESAGMERIEISYLDRSKFFRKNAFYGRWLIPPTESYRVGGQDAYAVGIGGKGGIVLFQWSVLSGGIPVGAVHTFPSLDVAMKGAQRQTKDIQRIFKEVQRRIHIPVVEDLDV